MNQNITIYHNPRCSKSRETLALITATGIEPDVVKYLDTPPTAKELASLIKALGISARDLLRKKEAEYKEHNLDDASKADADIIAAMVAAPKLIERPIVLKGDKAVIGRPPENVKTLL